MIFFMSNWSNIQWFFHDFFIFTNFKSFSWNSMIFPWSWNRSEFQWFFKSCRSPGNDMVLSGNITWNSADPDLCHHMMSLGYKDTGRERLRSSAVTINQNGGRRTRWVQTFADCVNTAPRSPSILRRERVMGPIDFLGVRNCSGRVGYCRYREGKISANWS